MAEQKSVFYIARVGSVVEDIAIGAEDLVSISGSVKSDKTTSTARHCCDVFCGAELPRGAKPRRWVPAVLIRFGVIRRV